MRRDWWSRSRCCCAPGRSVAGPQSRTPMNCLVFDIETVPDVEFGRRTVRLEGLDDAAVAKAMFARQRARQRQRFPAAHPAARGGDRLCAAHARSARGSGVSAICTRARPNCCALLRRHREIFARAGLLEWRRLRSAGAALSGAQGRRAGAALLGDRRGRRRLSLQQLSQPLPLAASGSDGRAVGLSAPRARAAGRCGGAAGLSGQARLLGRSGLGGLSARRAARRCAATARPMY